MIRATLLAFLCTGAASYVVVPPPERGGIALAHLELRISAKETSLRIGEKPHITATITNTGTAPAMLVLPGYDSLRGWRTPLVGFSVLKEGREKLKHPATVPPGLRGGCGNTDALKRREIFTLAPGQSKDLSDPDWDWLVSQHLKEPGIYRVVFYYTNDPRIVWRGIPIGWHDPEAMQQVKKSYACQLISQELKLEVRAK